MMRIALLCTLTEWSEILYCTKKEDQVSNCTPLQVILTFTQVLEAPTVK